MSKHANENDDEHDGVEGIDDGKWSDHTKIDWPTLWKTPEENNSFKVIICQVSMKSQ